MAAAADAAPTPMIRNASKNYDYTMQIATQYLIKVVIIINHQMPRYYFCQTCEVKQC